MIAPRKRHNKNALRGFLFDLMTGAILGALLFIFMWLSPA
jgi:hypothetical protein